MEELDPSVAVPLSEISGATDNLVLKHRLEEMEFSGGKPPDAASPTAEAAPEGTNTRDDRSASAN